MVQATDLQVFRAEEIVEFLIHQLTHGQYIFFPLVEPEPRNDGRDVLKIYAGAADPGRQGRQLPTQYFRIYLVNLALNVLFEIFL